ncbi:hypothetical protein GCM10011571_08480 [Marinithermofilum abyssi]|jgi:Protein of unknown function (DUF2553)|uniref:Uncharacterized protein n=1 Tax=Marinithermofilum abyssi TaxID=1571185 RepID=A0A8J2VHP3_9BACL|nr:DUF2553 family protein [Marinithermofilum abyssi]GGE09486.1 hypothetical protein GCM10011571_08480 [Marinithermofilum abyssi]
MSQDRQRVNITNRVTGRMANSGEMILYYNRKKIGTLDLVDKRLHMKEGYEADRQHIYMTKTSAVSHRHYTEDCDLGWC